MPRLSARLLCIVACWALLPALRAGEFRLAETRDQIDLETDTLHASIRKRGYVSGVYQQTFIDKKTGFRDAGFGLDIADWIMEPGSDQAYRDQLEPELVYQFDNPYHGKGPKRSIEGPQICTQAKEMQPVVIRGNRFRGDPADVPVSDGRSGKTAGST